MKITRTLTVITLFTLFVSATLGRAGSHTWSGAVNSLWSNAGNWSAGGAPVNGESPLYLTFPASATRYNPTNDVTGLQIDTLTLTGPSYTLYAQAGKTLTLKGTATNIVSSGFNNTFDASVGLILSSTNFINVASNVTLTINGPISGTGSLGKVGAGQLNFYGTAANTYAGTTFVLEGTLMLQRGLSAASPAIAIPGPLFIAYPNGSPGYVYTTLGYPEQIADNASVTINWRGHLDLVDYAETIGGLTLNYGSIDGAADALLTLHGDVTAQSYTNSSDIFCPVSLGGVTRTFNVLSTGYRLNMHNTIRDGGNNAGITKIGAGSLDLTASNSYAGLTLVKQGTISVSDPCSLGSINSGTVITNNGSLHILGNINVGAEPLTISGFGTIGYYSTYTDPGTNSWAGPVVIAADTAIDAPGASSSLTFTGPISGPGKLSLVGDGTVTFAGASSNTCTGAICVNFGKLQLNKNGVPAIAGPLIIGDGLGGANTGTVLELQPNQITDLAPVLVNSNGLFNLNSQYDTIGSLAGSGSVNLILGALTVGGDNTDTVFNGVIGGVGFAPITKNGTGTFTLNGTNTCSGTTTVNAGKLVVNGVLPGFLQMNSLSSLGGTGTVGNVTATLGHIAPGNSVGKINTGNLALNNANSSLDVQINGSAPGTGYDQIAAVGTVSLSNPTLNLLLGIPGNIGNKYLIITNDGADAVTGTFNGLPEGATFTNNGTAFKISYKGGDGNDVELTQLSVNAPLKFGSLQKLINGQILLNGTGFPGTNYTIQANTNLATTNWTSIGTVQADINGLFNFTDTNAPSFKQRFYRLTAP